MKEFHVQWHITDTCNIRCIDCYQEKYTTEMELGWKNGLRTVCDNILETMRIWDSKLSVALTGGEPLLKRELRQIIEYLNAQDAVSKISIITNGTLIDRYISELSGIKTAYRKFDKIFVSLDGVSPGVNDSIRGEGTFQKTVENVKLLVREKMPVVIMFTLMKSNYADAGKLYNFCVDAGVDGFIIERFIPLGRGKKITGEVVTGAELDALYRKILDTPDGGQGYGPNGECECFPGGTDYDPKEMVKYKALYVQLKKTGAASGRAPGVFGTGRGNEGRGTAGREDDGCGRAPSRTSRRYDTMPEFFGAECIVGRDGMAVLPDGTVLPCRRLPIPVGNLMSQPLHQIWQSSKVLQDTRNKNNLKGKCNPKQCPVEACFGCRAMTYSLTGDYLAEDPHCNIPPFFI